MISFCQNIFFVTVENMFVSYVFVVIDMNSSLGCAQAVSVFFTHVLNPIRDPFVVIFVVRFVFINETIKSHDFVDILCDIPHNFRIIYKYYLAKFCAKKHVLDAFSHVIYFADVIDQKKFITQYI